MSVFRKALVALFFALPASSVLGAVCEGGNVDSRLRVFCLSKLSVMKSTDVRSIQSVDFGLKSEGYARGIGLPGKVDPNRLTFVLNPIIEYNGDINGGNPNTPLVLGGLEFYGDPAFFKKQGILLGLGVGLTGRSIYGEGAYLDYSLGVSYAHSPKHGIGLMRFFGTFCNKRDVGANFYLDACISVNRSEREIFDTTSYNASVSLRKLIDAKGGAFHFGGLGYRRLFEGAYEQDQVLFVLESIYGNGLISSISFSLGEKIPNNLVQRRGLSVEFSSEVKGRNVSVALAQSYSDGGMLLGFERAETTKVISISYPIRPMVSVSLGYKYIESSIDHFDDTELTFGIQVKPIQF